MNSFHVAPFCVLHSFVLHLFACCTFSMLHLFCVASCCSRFMFPFFHVAVFFMLHSFNVAIVSCCTLFRLHFFRVTLFPSCTRFMLHLLLYCIVFILYLISWCTVAIFCVCVFFFFFVLFNIALSPCCTILMLQFF